MIHNSKANLNAPDAVYTCSPMKQEAMRRMELWMQRTGATKASWYKGRFCPLVLADPNHKHRGYCRYSTGLSGLLDHLEWWIGPRGECIAVGHDYNGAQDWLVDRLRVLLVRYRLPKMEIDHWISWYYPDRTTLIALYGRPPEQGWKPSPWPDHLFKHEHEFVDLLGSYFSCDKIRKLIAERLDQLVDLAYWTKWPKLLAPATDPSWMDTLEHGLHMDLHWVRVSLREWACRHIATNKLALDYMSYLSKPAPPHEAVEVIYHDEQSSRAACATCGTV